MKASAASVFTIERFDTDEPYATFGPVRYARSHLVKRFRGDLEATSEVAMLAVQGAGGAGYVALETVQGTLQGRAGTFALLHAGTMAGEELWAQWPVAPGSGTKELEGITGQATIEVDPDGTHHLHLEYELPSP